MIDVSMMPTTLRRARAQAILRARPETVERVRAGTVPKGDVLEAARAAAILAAKRTADLIPHCHPIPLSHAEAEFELRADAIVVTTAVAAVWRTGVEMEALTSAALGALTLYDMLKPLDDSLEIEHVILLEKRGGKSDAARAIAARAIAGPGAAAGAAAGAAPGAAAGAAVGAAPGAGPTARAIRAAAVVISDSVAAGRREDRSGAAIVEVLASFPVEVVSRAIVPDDRAAIEATLRRLCDEERCDLVLTTGGTGLSPRDVTVEATRAVLDREVPGIAEAARAFGQERTARAMLSRATAGFRGHALIVNLPGSPDGVRESLAGLLPELLHAVPMIAGEGHEA